MRLWNKYDEKENHNYSNHKDDNDDKNVLYLFGRDISLVNFLVVQLMMHGSIETSFINN